MNNETLLTHVNALRAEYETDADMIVRRAGKFENEHIATVYLYDAMLNGDTPEYQIDDEQWLVKLEESEKQAFGFEADYVLMSETCSGFVTGTLLSRDQGESIIENGAY